MAFGLEMKLSGLDGVLDLLKRLPPEIVCENAAMKTGVYAIVNLINGKAYIGSAARSFAKRFRNHKFDLARGEHHSLPLQRAWNKYGKEAFEFAPVAFTPPEMAVETEQLYIDTWWPAYNVSPIARSALGVKHTEESKARMKAGSLLANARPEVKALRSAVQKELWSRPEFKARKTAAQNRPDVKARKSATVLETWADPTIVARRLEGMKLAHARSDVKAQKSAAIKERWKDASYREERSANTKSRWQDPEYRARMCAMSKASHAAPGAKQLRGAAISATARSKSKITTEVAVAIQQALSDGVTGSSLAAKYGVTGALISTIKLGTHWACKK